MKVIKSIDDYLNASPEEVEMAFSQVTIMKNLEDWLAWLSASETTTEVRAKLQRYKKRAKGIHPSSACKKNVCKLKLYYECTHDIEPRKAYVQEDQLTWDTGTILHETYQAHFGNMYGDIFSAEVNLEIPDLHVKSRTDGLFDFDLVRIVLEMKSIKEGGNFGWATIQKGPMEDNVRQLHFYMVGSDTPFGLLFYMNKNAGKLKEHPVKFDPEIWQDILDTIQPVSDAVYNNGPMVEALPGWHCRYCDFNHACPAAKQERTHVKGTERPWGGNR